MFIAHCPHPQNGGQIHPFRENQTRVLNTIFSLSVLFISFCCWVHTNFYNICILQLRIKFVFLSWTLNKPTNMQIRIKWKHIRSPCSKYIDDTLVGLRTCWIFGAMRLILYCIQYRFLHYQFPIIIPFSFIDFVNDSTFFIELFPLIFVCINRFINFSYHIILLLLQQIICHYHSSES